MLKNKNHIIVSKLILLFILSGSTCREYEPCPSTFNFITTLKKDSNFITVQYQYAFGIGQENSFITPDSFNDNQFYPDQDSIFFILPANLKEDNVFFSLVDKNLNKDTIGISYTKKISVNNKRYCRKTYATITSSKIIFLSNRFLKDSCRIEKGFNESQNLILVKK